MKFSLRSNQEDSNPLSHNVTTGVLIIGFVDASGLLAHLSL